MDGDLSEDQKYQRAALTNQYNVILALGAAAFAIALASWWPLIVGVIGEVTWLLVGPRLEAFRRHTDARITRAGNAKVIDALGADYALRVAGVEREAAEIERLCATRVDLSPDQKREVVRRLLPAIQNFVRVCGMHQRLRALVEQSPVNELSAEVSTLLASLSTETDLGVRSSLRRALNSAERRSKEFEANEAALHALELALATLQRSLTMLKEGAAGLSTGPELCIELDAAMSQLSHAAALEAERELELSGNRMSVLPPALN